MLRFSLAVLLLLSGFAYPLSGWNRPKAPASPAIQVAGKIADLLDTEAARRHRRVQANHWRAQVLLK